MSEKFKEVGLKADFLISGSSNRDDVKSRLLKKEINYLFVVDIFNEGVDIPQIDTILFLRPTESLTVFLQQLGRGLRFTENKECLTVLDFVGNARDEYDFEGKFRNLIGKTSNSVKDEIENEFPHLPLGCSIVLEKKAKEHILNNIKKATTLGRRKLISKIRNYENQTTLPLTIRNFTKINHLSLENLYKKDSFSKLCYEADILEDFDEVNEKELIRVISKKWLLTRSHSYFEFILELIDKITHIESDLNLPYFCPIKLHSRYTREQILSGFGQNSFQKKSSSREGVLNIKDKNTELLFVTL